MSDLQLLGNCHSSNCLAECSTSGVGVTKDTSAIGNFLHDFQQYKNTFYLLNIISYLSGVTTAKLRWHLLNMNMIWRI